MDWNAALENKKKQKSATHCTQHCKWARKWQSFGTFSRISKNLLYFHSGANQKQWEGNSTNDRLHNTHQDYSVSKVVLNNTVNFITVMQLPTKSNKLDEANIVSTLLLMFPKCTMRKPTLVSHTKSLDTFRENRHRHVFPPQRTQICTCIEDGHEEGGTRPAPRRCRGWEQMRAVHHGRSSRLGSTGTAPSAFACKLLNKYRLHTIKHCHTLAYWFLLPRPHVHIYADIYLWCTVIFRASMTANVLSKQEHDRCAMRNYTRGPILCRFFFLFPRAVAAVCQPLAALTIYLWCEEHAAREHEFYRLVLLGVRLLTCQVFGQEVAKVFTFCT